MYSSPRMYIYNAKDDGANKACAATFSVLTLLHPFLPDDTDELAQDGRLGLVRLHIKLGRIAIAGLTCREVQGHLHVSPHVSLTLRLIGFLLYAGQF